MTFFVLKFFVLKEVPQNFTEFLTLMTSQLMTLYGETNIAKKKN